MSDTEKKRLVVRGGEDMPERLYEIEIGQTPNAFTAKMKGYVKPQKPIREYKGSTFEEILEQLVRDILDEVDE